MEVYIETTVLAAIIAGIFAIITSRKQDRLQYITAERSKWREEVRNIALKITKVNRKELGTVLVELKVRLNAYGKSNKNRFDKDFHILTLIDKMEEEIVTKPILKLYKKLLIEYLSLLLKYDWERVKKEVKGEQNRIFSYLSLLIVYGIFVFSMVNYSLENEKIQSTVIVLFLIITFIILIITFVVIRIPVSEFNNIALLWYCKSKKSNNILPSILYKILLGVMLSSCVLCGMYFVQKEYNSFGISSTTYYEYPLYYILIFLMAIFCAYFIFISNCTAFNVKIDYFYSIIRENEIAVNNFLESIESLQIRDVDAVQVYNRYLEFLTDSKNKDEIINRIYSAKFAKKGCEEKQTVIPRVEKYE